MLSEQYDWIFSRRRIRRDVETEQKREKDMRERQIERERGRESRAMGTEDLSTHIESLRDLSQRS